MYDEYLDEFMPSEYMREYLKHVELTSRQITELIYYSPKPAGSKQKAFNKLRKLAEDQGDNELAGECLTYLWNLDEAMNHLDTEGVFLVTHNYFDDEKKDIEEDDQVICANLADVMEYDKTGIHPWFYEEDVAHYISTEKWEPDENGKYCCVCEYVIARGEILYIALDDDAYHTMKNKDYCRGADLNLPVAFKAGDLIETDGFPFGPKNYMLIVGIGNNRDCCCVQGLARTKEGDWNMGAVKHGMVGFSYYPKVSMLYSAHMIEGGLPEEESLLVKVKEYLGKDEGRAEWAQDWLPWIHMTDEELLESLKKTPEELEQEFNSRYGGKIKSIIGRHEKKFAGLK